MRDSEDGHLSSHPVFNSIILIPYNGSIDNDESEYVNFYSMVWWNHPGSLKSCFPYMSIIPSAYQVKVIL